jgi:VanZ family protein
MDPNRSPQRAVPGAATPTWLWRTAFALLAVAVAYLALTPTPPHAIDTGWDKLNHFLAFGALGVSCCFSGPRTRGWLLLTSLALLAFGGAIELLQMQVPGRDAEWGDLLADSIGITAALCAVSLWRGKQR